MRGLLSLRLIWMLRWRYAFAHYLRVSRYLRVIFRITLHPMHLLRLPLLRLLLEMLSCLLYSQFRLLWSDSILYHTCYPYFTYSPLSLCLQCYLAKCYCCLDIYLDVICLKCGDRHRVLKLAVLTVDCGQRDDRARTERTIEPCGFETALNSQRSLSSPSLLFPPQRPPLCRTSPSTILQMNLYYTARSLNGKMSLPFLNTTA